MLAALPLAYFALIFAALLRREERVAGSVRLRSGFLEASVVWGLTLTAITELLGLANRLTPGWTAVAWAAVCLAAAAVCVRSRGVGSVITRTPVAAEPPATIALIGAAVGIVAVVGLIAVLAPPNNYDSMTYHMARVAHWVQNQSVAHFPTAIQRQLQHAPWAEFSIANFQVLTGGDRLANGVQWFALVGSALGVSLIALQLGAGSLGQAFAALFVVTIPMGILQGSSTQNDFVVAFWLVCFAYFVLRAMEKEGKDRASNMAAAASLGLAVLTKSTAYVFALPFVAWGFLVVSRRLGWRAWKPFALVALVALTINLGHFARNYRLYGSVHGNRSAAYTNDVFGAGVLVSNLVRNVGLHVETPFGSVNGFLDSGAKRLLEALGLDPDDPRTTWQDEEFRISRPSNNEDFAGNALHLVLVLVAVAMYLSLRRADRSGLVGGYILACGLGFVLFCALLKWQPWHSRLHLPAFVLSAAFVGAIPAIAGRRGLVLSVAAVLVVAALPWVFYNYSRPVIPWAFEVEGRSSLGGSHVFADRTEQYFSHRPELEKPYVGAAERIRSLDCSDIGLDVGNDDWEYPFWVLLLQDGKERRLEHVNVENRSARAASVEEPFVPCAVILVDRFRPASDAYRIGRRRYTKLWFSAPVTVYVKSVGSKGREGVSSVRR